MTFIKIAYSFMGFIIGMIVASLVAYYIAADVMIVENESKYSFEETIEKLQQISVEKGWHGSNEINRVFFDPEKIDVQQIEKLLKKSGTYLRTLQRDE